jgi:hypothetical protein
MKVTKLFKGHYKVEHNGIVYALDSDCCESTKQYWTLDLFNDIGELQLDPFQRKSEALEYLKNFCK